MGRGCTGRVRTVTLPWQQLPQLLSDCIVKSDSTNYHQGPVTMKKAFRKKKKTARDSNDWGLCWLVFDTPAIRSAFHPHIKPALNFSYRYFNTKADTMCNEKTVTSLNASLNLVHFGEEATR